MFSDSDAEESCERLLLKTLVAENGETSVVSHHIEENECSPL